MSLTSTLLGFVGLVLLGCQGRAGELPDASDGGGRVEAPFDAGPGEPLEPSPPVDAGAPEPQPDAGVVPTAPSEWTQHAHDPQHSSYTDVAVPMPWRWKWAWNGSDASGKVGTHVRLPARRRIQPVTGAGRVYLAYGAGVVALSQANGAVLWDKSPGGTIESTAAFDSASSAVFVTSTDGKLYRLSAATGETTGSFTATAAIETPPVVLEDRVLVSAGTRVHAVSKDTLRETWSYDAGSTVHTPPAFSAVRNTVVVGTADLFVHAVDNADGRLRWKTKPGPQTAGSPNEYRYGWPVIAEVHGLVLVKMRLDWAVAMEQWPTSNAAIASMLDTYPGRAALFALKLTDGSTAFRAHVGHGGYGDGGYMPMGPMPVVKRFPDGQEVVYTIIRGRHLYDGRWDSSFGEMVLDDQTVSGLSAGHVRWIYFDPAGADTPWPRPYLLTDEQPNPSMAGDQLFGGHWLAGHALRIVDRSSGLGSYERPVTSENLAQVIENTSTCTFDARHHCPSGLSHDGRTYGPGFYIFHNAGSPYDTYWSEYATFVVSNGLVLFRSCSGALVALESGDPRIAVRSPPTRPVSRRMLAQAKRLHPPRDGVAASGQALLTDRTAFDHVGEVRTVTGRIGWAYRNELKSQGFAFGDDTEGHFKAIVLKKDFHKFPRDWTRAFPLGTHVQVRGRIRWYQGDPIIEVTEPDQIQKVRFGDG